MKRIYLLYILSCLYVGAVAQEATQNYIRTRTMLNESDALDNIQYYDGLGRPFMAVQKSITPAKTNLTLQEYDGMGREAMSWLPHVISTDYIAPSAFKSQVVATYVGDTRPFSQPIYEPSPLNRMVKQYGPGVAWNNNPIATDYLTNTKSGDLCCKLYEVNAAGVLVMTKNFSPAELYVTKSPMRIGMLPIPLQTNKNVLS